MNSNLMSLLIIAGELLLVLAVLFSGYVYLIARKGRKERDQAVRFVQKLKTGEAERVSELKHTLKDFYRLDDELLEQNVESLLALEKALYTRFLRIFLRKDQAALMTLDDQVESLLKGYRELTPGGVVDSGALSDLEQRYQALEAEKTKVEDELHQTKAAMDQILGEYASMYGGNHAEVMSKLGGQLKQQKSESKGEEPES